ncbi:MAG: SDR family NAD(P)-dependent oxidoreductase, partial [Acidimicrobiia bacterium]
MTTNEGRLSGKVALITGAARGLGAQMARRFRDEGATPIITDLSEAACRTLADELGGDAYALDVTDSAAVTEVFAKVAANHGRLDILVNNAGISGMEDRPEEVQRGYDITMAQMADAMAGDPPSVFNDVTLRTTDDEWHRVLAVHLDGTFFCTREAMRIMGPQQSGAIINLGSIMGTSGGAGAAAYCAAKAGILGLTRSHAREFVAQG